jgi:peptidoglycan hydrolase CwlO-like protein
MTRLLWLTLLTLLLAACTAVSHKEKEGSVKLTPEQVKEEQQKADYLKSQIAAKDVKIDSAEEEAQNAEQELETLRAKRATLSREREEKLKELERLLAEAKELAGKLREPTAEEEDTARELLLKAEFFERDNPTEARSIVASKYKDVFERHPRTKAAGEAKARYDHLTEE